MNIDQALADAVEHHRAGRLEQAATGYRAIIAFDPENAAAWINLGAALRALGRTTEAVSALDHAVRLLPDNAGAWFNLGNARTDAGDFEAACHAFASAAEIAPDGADVYLNWGDALIRMSNAEQAAATYRRGLERCPGDARLMSNLGNALLDLHDVGPALAMLEAATRQTPGDPTMQRNLANGLRLAGERTRAIGILDKLIADADDDADSRCLRAFAHFAEGDFAAAWDDYAWRWRSAHHEAPRPFAQPRWNGEDLNGKTLLVWGEQAVGDELMFATMLPHILARANHVIIETEHRLQPLLRRSFPDAEVLARTDPPASRLLGGDIDFQIATGDLGQRLRRGREDFTAGPYLRADEAETERFRARYAALAARRPRVGISWGSRSERAGAARSLYIGSLARLLNGADVWWLSLQYGDTRAALAELAAADCTPPHVDLEIDPLAALDPQAAQLAGLDMVVSVANTTVHVAGALGVPTAALLPHVADWRWLAAGENCLWYPTVTLLRQTEPGDWTPAIAKALDQIMLRSRSAER